jgi:hypothetical protein
MDHYTITRASPTDRVETLMADGSWAEIPPGKDGRWYDSRGGLGWMWGLPLRDGRYVGWNSHGCLPLFVGRWIETDSVAE